MQKFIKRNKFGLIALVPGAILGYLYWYYVGCNSGTCPITNIWYNSALFGSVMGFLGGNMIDDAQKKKAEREIMMQEQENSNR